jgi:hypothetical protein
MIWLAPAAWLGALALAAPVLIHLLARTRAATQPFPTLRFLPAMSQAALRRRRIDERWLLAVRCAIVLTAVSAFAAPLAVTRARRAAWNARVIRETVSDGDVPLRTGLYRAIADLDFAPPGRRQIVVRSTFPLAAITDADVATVPNGVGLTFDRTGSLQPRREFDAPPILSGSADDPRQVSRRVLLDGVRTTVVDGRIRPASLPIEIDAPVDVSRLLNAVLNERVVAAVDHRVHLIMTGAPSFDASIRSAAPVRAPWMADAIAAIAHDRDLREAIDRSTTPLPSTPFGGGPWHVVAMDREGRPLVAAAAGTDARLLVAAANTGSDLVTAVLLRSLLNAIAPAPAAVAPDVVATSDAQLRTWTRPAGPAPEPRVDTVGEDDRRVLWIVMAVLMGVEWWMRRNDR